MALFIFVYVLTGTYVCVANVYYTYYGMYHKLICMTTDKLLFVVVYSTYILLIAYSTLLYCTHYLQYLHPTVESGEHGEPKYTPFILFTTYLRGFYLPRMCCVYSVCTSYLHSICYILRKIFYTVPTYLLRDYYSSRALTAQYF